MAARSIGFARIALGVLLSLASASACERSAEESRALIAEHRASWVREIAGIKEQHAALLVRIARQGSAHGSGPAQQRTRAVLDGAQQSIGDVEIELAQCQRRMEAAAYSDGEAARRVIDVETVKARGYLQLLGAQLSAAAQQVDALASLENG